MTKLTPLLTALALVLGVAACGSSSTNSTTTPPSVTSTPAAAQPAPTPHQPNAKTQKATAQAQKLVRQVASETGRLASGNSSADRAARNRLAQLESQSNALARSATHNLSRSNPARPLIVQASRQVGQVSGTLRHMQLNAASRRTLRNVQGTLTRLSAAIGQLNGSAALASGSSIMSDLHRLQRQLASQATGGASGA